LVIFGVDVSNADGEMLHKTALANFGVDDFGIPALIVGTHVLVGAHQIEQELPMLIDGYLAENGVGWPEIPGLAEAMIAAQPEAQAEQDVPGVVEATATPFMAMSGEENQSSSGVWERMMLDPLGNGMAVLVLVGMVSVATAAVMNFRRLDVSLPSKTQVWLFPALTLLGSVVSGYLAYVETTQVRAVCGPVGDCNTVQQSEYARLFGILPVGVFGLIGYLAILISWLVGRLNRHPLSYYSNLALLVLTSFGLAFSIYLTFLEPFVIGATCAWCLTSAIITTALFWLALQPGKGAWLALRH
jgi:uncharacterized membrane protein